MSEPLHAAARAGAHRSRPRRASSRRDQPAGVPPLELTGERTLPDVPEENYWFQRHLVVYEWIARARRRPARRRHGLRRGLRHRRARRARAAEVVGVDANPEAYEHAARALRAARRALRAHADRDVRRAVRRRRLPADDRARARTPATCSSTSRSIAGSAGGVVYVSTPNVLTLAPEGAERSRATRGTCTSTAPRSSARCCAAHFGEVELFGLFHARKLRAHELAIEQLGWDRVHARLRHHRSRSTTASRRRSPRATSRSSREHGATSTARSTSWRSAAP